MDARGHGFGIIYKLVNQSLTKGDIMAGHTKTKSKKQVGLLLSSNSPLKPSQKATLKRELKTGAVKVGKGRKKR